MIAALRCWSKNSCETTVSFSGNESSVHPGIDGHPVSVSALPGTLLRAGDCDVDARWDVAGAADLSPHPFEHMRFEGAMGLPTGDGGGTGSQGSCPF